MAGYRKLLAVEWDANAVATFRQNFPGVPVYHGDMGKLSVELCMARAGLAAGDLDVLDGSPPCQGFSMAGRRQMDDPRNGLFREYVRLLRGLRPRAFVIENVGGMVKGKMKCVFAEILKVLKDSGYGVSVRLLNAKYYGVAQSRPRVIFVGIRDDVEAVPSHPPGVRRLVSVAEALAGCRRDEPRRMPARVVAMWGKIRPGQNGSHLGSKNTNFSLVKVRADRPCPTILRSQLSFCGLMHWSECRFLTASELARLGSFPDEFEWVGGPGDVVQRVGNSVPPLFMRAVAAHVRGLIRPWELT